MTLTKEEFMAATEGKTSDEIMAITQRMADEGGITLPNIQQVVEGYTIALKLAGATLEERVALTKLAARCTLAVQKNEREGLTASVDESNPSDLSVG